MLSLVERKQGVLESQYGYPDNPQAHIAALEAYAKKIDRHKVRVCFAAENIQDMLVACRSDSFTLPHLQHGRTISYDIELGHCSLFVFRSDLQPDFLLTLRSGQSICLPAALPRTMVFHTPMTFFRERLTGGFSDSDTIWPWGKECESFDRNTLIKMREEFVNRDQGF